MQNRDPKTIIYKDGRWEVTTSNTIREQAVTLTINNEPWLAFMCTPMDLEDLAIGFLFNEGIIQSLEEVASIRVCPGNDNIDVWLNRAASKPDKWIRTSGCSGGRTGIDERNRSHRGVIAKNGAMLPAQAIGLLITQLINAQKLYKQSGGIHASALCDGERIMIYAEDIGRHNTLDKLAGKFLREKIILSKRIILTTGRISSEMLQKAERFGASIIISRTSPTSLSVRMAEEAGITLIGYARRDRFTVYTHPERIVSINSTEKVHIEAR